MRSFLTWPLAVLAFLFCGMAVQQWQLGRLHGRLTRQAAALEESQQQVADLTAQLATAEAARAVANARNQLRPPAADSAFWREDERRLMLSGYGVFLARTNLPPARMARLKDLLVERAEALSDAKDAAADEGIADGTPEMQRATTAATADLDREIAGLLGPPSDLRARELTVVSGQNENAAPYPYYQGGPLASPAYAYPADTAATIPAALVSASPVVDYMPVGSVLYADRRDGRFNERPPEERRPPAGPRPEEPRPEEPRPVGAHPPDQHPGERPPPSKTGPVH